jgi:hypothetical protein
MISAASRRQRFRRRLAFVLPLLMIHIPGPASARVFQTPSSATCREWQECRQRALEAAEQRDFEVFHDLAWRTVQIGPPRNPELMYLLARAQCLSGRPHDALIMLRRLTEMGVSSDAATNDDFERTRALPGWPEVEALMATVTTRAGAASRATAPPVATSPPAPVATSPTTASPTASTSRAAAPPTATGLAVLKPARTEAAVVRISTPRFAVGGLAYDAVSHRFVVGDLHGRKLIVISEGSDHSVDLVRADSAGFHDIRAIEIDARRGDLWVATATTSSEWVIHKLQLLSGRPLKAVQTGAQLGQMNFVDLAVSPAGAVLALDSVESRLLVLRPGGASLEPSVRMAIQNPTSLTAAGDEGSAYVAHRGGVSRVDVKTGAAVPVAVPMGLEFGTIERIRWYGEGLVAVQIASDGSRRIVRFDLNPAGRSVIAATIIDATIPAVAGPTFATVSGNELSYLVVDSTAPGSSSQPSRDAPAPGLAEFVIRRIRLR